MLQFFISALEKIEVISKEKVGDVGVSLRNGDGGPLKGVNFNVDPSRELFYTENKQVG